MNSKVKQNMPALEKELLLLRSFMIGIAGKDKEGAYRPEFVSRILRGAGKRPGQRFRSAASFLADLRKNAS